MCNILIDVRKDNEQTPVGVIFDDSGDYLKIVEDEVVSIFTRCGNEGVLCSVGDIDLFIKKH